VTERAPEAPEAPEQDDGPAAWGRRGWLCLVCRTALAPGASCGNPAHGEPVAVASPDGRARLAARIYGYPPASPWRAGARGPYDPSTRLARRWLRQRFGARGALPAGRDVGPEPGRWGVVRAPHAAPPPWGGPPCAAYALELRAADRGPQPLVMLRDAGCQALAIDLDDGARVHVPAGAIVVALGAAGAVTPGPAALARYLAWIGVAPAPGLRDVVPFDALVAALVHDGDRVEVRGALVDATEAASGGAYRDAPARRPAGVARLVVARRT
jgi:hypothetical protein